VADINKRPPDCNDCEKERGKRGRRGHRGHRGHVGRSDGDKQVFRYVATGIESNPVTIGAGQGFRPRASANYNVQLTMAGPLSNTFKDPRPLASTFTAIDFQVEAPVVFEAGDVLQFTVEDLA
jgi:hypothetical protein